MMKGMLFFCILIILSLTLNAQVIEDELPAEPSADGRNYSDSSGHDSAYLKHESDRQWGVMEANLYEFIISNFQYPERCLEEGIGGYVLVRFMVDTTGDLSNFSIVDSTASCPEFTKEALRVLKSSPRLIPARSNGRYVKCYRQLPIRLCLE